MRTLERNAMDGADDYGAIPYQVLACAHGLTEGRTVRKVNGANGGSAVNVTHGSVCVLVGTTDPVTAAHKRHTRAALDYLDAPVLVTHGDIRPDPTACPGPELTRWVHAGAPVPGTPTKGDTVRYLSVSMDTDKPLSVVPDTWTRIKWHTEAHDDWNGHTAPAIGEIVLPEGIVSGGVQLETTARLEVRVIRGTRDGSKTGLASEERGPGRFVVSIPPAVAKDSLFVEVRAIIAAAVLSGALRLTVADRA
jgi:hypothetical protein